MAGCHVCGRMTASKAFSSPRLTSGFGTQLWAEEASESIQNEAAKAAEIETNNGNPQTSPEGEAVGTGCLSCGRDDDHANLLLCEACNAEYHTYVMSRRDKMQFN